MTAPPAKVTGVLLAAGASTRMGARNKLLIPLEGSAMVRRSAEILLATLDDVVAVTGFEADRIAGALGGTDLRVVFNPDHSRGLGTSVAAGVRAAGTAAAVVIALADMPFVQANTVRALVRAFREDPVPVRVPVHEGRRGNPVLWPRAWFDVLTELDGDRGAREVMVGNPSSVLEVEVDDRGIHCDIDTPEAGLRGPAAALD